MVHCFLLGTLASVGLPVFPGLESRNVLSPSLKRLSHAESIGRALERCIRLALQVLFLGSQLCSIRLCTGHVYCNGQCLRLLARFSVKAMHVLAGPRGTICIVVVVDQWVQQQQALT